jgi:hypothetical protein
MNIEEEKQDIHICHYPFTDFFVNRAMSIMLNLGNELNKRQIESLFYG